MQTEALKLAQQSADNNLIERLSYGKVELQVTDLERTLDFWTVGLGLIVRDRGSQKADIGTREKTLFVLHAGASRPVAPHHLGMYHVAIGLPDQAEFSRILAKLIASQIPISLVDHLMSKAIYLQDPDGLEIEFAVETPERFGRFGDMSQGLIMYDAEGRPHSGRARVDINKELTHAAGADTQLPLSDKTTIAHLHLKVADLESATAWFESVGFTRNLMIPNFGFADLGAGAAYTHRIAINTWAGPNLNPAPSDMARLLTYTLVANDPELIINNEVLQAGKHGLTGVDPTETPLTLIPANPT